MLVQTEVSIGCELWYKMLRKTEPYQLMINDAFNSLFNLPVAYLLALQAEFLFGFF